MAAVKMTGFMFKKYWDDKAYWGDCYIEDDVILVNGDQCEDIDTDIITDDSAIEIKSGVVITPNGDMDNSLTAHVRKWLKSHKSTTVLIEVDREKVESLMSAIVPAIVAHGGKVVSK